ncbi:MAG: hypothetical protein D4R43_01480 [Sphingobacteriales bacterium]|nr:MAG: hypothetical protein D4R43_01480 [Sphingobacteriales bacterium]
MNRNKILIASLLFFQLELSSECSEAQINFTQFQDQHTFSQASQFMPSLIGEGIRKYKITFFDFYGAASNSSFSLAQLNKLSEIKTWNDNTVDSLLNNLKTGNSIYAGGNFSFLNVSFNINKHKRKFLSFAIGTRERLDLNMLYSHNLISLLLKGNKQFAGETVNLSPLSINFLQCSDYYFGMKTLLGFKVGKKTLLKLKPALQFHYLTSMANVYSEKSDLALYTQQDGRELNLNYDYDLYIASPGNNMGTHGVFGDVTVKDITKNLFSGVGNGKSFDFGLGADVNDWIKINMAVTDVGAISFKNHSVNYSGNGAIEFDGFSTNYTETQNSFNTQADSMLSLLKPNFENAQYKAPLATKYFTNVSLNLLKKRKKNGMVYFRHTFNVTYIKGFKNYLNATTTPLMVLGYNYSVGNILNFGIIAAKGGTAQTSVGANLSLQFSHYQLWCNSNNLLPFIGKQNAKGIDGAVGMGMEF